MIDTLSERCHVTQNGFCLMQIEAFVRQRQGQGYATNSVKLSRLLVEDYAAWLDQRAIDDNSLSAAHSTAYLNQRWLHKRRRRGDVFTLHSFDRLVAPDGYKANAVQKPTIEPGAQVRQDFERYLLNERGLAAASIRLYGDSVGLFLNSTFGDRAVLLDQLTATDVIDFVQTYAAHVRHPKRAKVMTSALRAFLQYGRYRGEIVVDLHSCVPTVADWSKAGIPKTISPAQVQGLLAGCDQQSVAGNRDYAMLLLISRLGLRASEVVDLTLDDIDWAEGIIRIRGPASRVDSMPLPSDVGAALVDYLRNWRPACAARNVFLRSRAPQRALLGPSSVSCIVLRALKRAGIDSPSKGAHLLRHSLATQMLGGGASLGEIAEILRHRNPQTTTIYAKVDLASLQTLALPWPGGSQ